MIVGVGVDVVDVARIGKAMKNPRFVRRVLTENERAECNTATKVAGRWAAKEAIAKALQMRFSWQDLEILSNGGPPRVRLITKALSSRPVSIHLSISHERNVAIAFAIAEA